MFSCPFLFGVFAKLRIATISFVISVRLHGTTRLPLNVFLWNLTLIDISKKKCYGYNVDIHNIFIDYIHAFDSIKRNKILDSLTQNKIPPKLIRLIKITLEHTTAK